MIVIPKNAPAEFHNLVHAFNERFARVEARIDQLELESRGGIKAARRALASTVNQQAQSTTATFSCPFWSGDELECGRPGGCTFNPKTGQCGGKE